MIPEYLITDLEQMADRLSETVSVAPKEVAPHSTGWTATVMSSLNVRQLRENMDHRTQYQIQPLLTAITRSFGEVTPEIKEADKRVRAVGDRIAELKEAYAGFFESTLIRNAQTDHPDVIRKQDEAIANIAECARDALAYMRKSRMIE